MATKSNINFKNDLAAEAGTIFPAGAILELRTGSRPADAEQAASGTLVVSFTLGATPWLSPAAGVLALDADLGPENAVADGPIGWARLKNAADTRRIDYVVSVAGGGGDLILQNTSVLTGQAVTIDAGTITIVDP